MLRFLRKAIIGTYRRMRPPQRTRRGYRLPMEGFVFVIVTLLIGLAAVNTGAQLLYLVFGMLCAFWVLSDVLATSSMRGYTVDRIAPRVVTARTPVRVALRIKNRKKFFSTFGIRVIDNLIGDFPVGAVFFTRIKPNDELTEDYRCVFPRRGVYRFDRILAVTRFPFGLIQRTLIIQEPWEILVLPASISVDRTIRRARVDLGEHETAQKGRGTSLYGIREYVPGESARDIHWKLSARSNALMLREYESEEKRRATVILDNRLPEKASFEEQEQLEKAIVLTGSVLTYLIERGHQVELLTASGKVAFGFGPQHLLRCRRALASLGQETADAHPPELHGIEEGTVIFCIQCRSRDVAPAGAVVLRVSDHDAELKEAISDLGEPKQEKLLGIEKL